MKLKKILCCLLMPALLLTACSSPDKDNNSSEVSADNSQRNESTESEVSEDPSSDEESEASKTPQDAVYRTVISIGKPYTGPQAVDSYPDTYGSELTDGLYAESDLGYSDPRWSDYGRPDPVSFIIDLGEVTEKIYAFEISFFHDWGPGIGVPQSVFVQWSNDGEKWDGSATIPTPSEPNVGSNKSTRVMKKYLSARYIRFSMSHSSANLFLDELSVIADVPPAEESSAISELVKEAYNSDSYDYTSAVSSLATGTPDYAKPCTAIATGCKYTFSRPAGAKFPDNIGKLTDGLPLGSVYESGNYVGFDGDDKLDITVALSKSEKDLSRFEVSMYANATLGIILPAYVDIFASSDSNTFTKIGRMYAPTYSVEGAITYTLSLQSTIEAKYVRFSFPEQSKKSLLIEELGIFAYRDAKADAFVSFYKEEAISKVEREVLFNANDSDYNDRINLIAGLGQKIYSYCPLAAGTYGNTPESSRILTDGKRASRASYTDSAFFKFGSGEGRDVIYDFGATASVDGFSLSFLIETPVGINSISTVLFYLSDDGINWYAVKSAALPSTENTEFLRFDYELDRTYKARFARFSFRVWPNAYCDELEVWGTKNASKASPLASTGIEPYPLNKGKYTERDKHLGGANDIVLLPNYSAADEKAGKPDTGYSVDELMPYVAYLDRDGKIIDTMFDGVLFCPTGSALNGGHFYADATMAEIEDMIVKTFLKGRDIDALETAVGTVKKTLGDIDDYKVKIYIPICYPGKGVVFGDLDGDGVADTLNTADDRVRALKWQADFILKCLSENTYENVVFAGFYWQNESMNPDDDEQYIVSSITSYAKSLGYEMFWIPYYKAAGFDQWQIYGFNLACMQPNYAFSTSVPEAQLDYCATITKRLGMCVEMELMEATLTDKTYFDKYMSYLKSGVKHGYMNDTVHIYYQSIDVYATACCAESDLARLVYTYTYDFIKGNLQLVPEKDDDSSISVKANTQYASTLNKTSTDAVAYRIIASPEHGTITLTPDGRYTYYPQNGFNGSDSFTYSVSNHLGESAPVTVTVSVN